MYFIQKIKSKIHGAYVNDAFLDYEGSVTIGKELLDLSNMESGEKVQVLNIENGTRIETYIIEGKGKEINLNGPAAHFFKKGDHVIIISYLFQTKDKSLMPPTRLIMDGSPDNNIKETLNE